jgi:hypothetical protein
MNEEAKKMDGNYNTNRTSPHIFVTDSNTCINGNLNKIGYRLYQKNGRVIMQSIRSGDEEPL